MDDIHFSELTWDVAWGFWLDRELNHKKNVTSLSTATSGYPTRKQVSFIYFMQQRCWMDCELNDKKAIQNNCMGETHINEIATDLQQTANRPRPFRAINKLVVPSCLDMFCVWRMSRKSGEDSVCTMFLFQNWSRMAEFHHTAAHKIWTDISCEIQRVVPRVSKLCQYGSNI